MDDTEYINIPKLLTWELNKLDLWELIALRHEVECHSEKTDEATLCKQLGYGEVVGEIMLEMGDSAQDVLYDAIHGLRKADNVPLYEIEQMSFCIDSECERCREAEQDEWEIMRDLMIMQGGREFIN